MKTIIKTQAVTKDNSFPNKELQFACDSHAAKSIALTGISILLFVIVSAFLFYGCVVAMDALSIIEEVQKIVMLLMGVGSGFAGFSIFKRLFYACNR